MARSCMFCTVVVVVVEGGAERLRTDSVQLAGDIRLAERLGQLVLQWVDPPRNLNRMYIIIIL